LPPDLVEELGLKFHKRGQAVLGDGSTVVFDTYGAVILWNGRARRIAIDAAEVGRSRRIRPYPSPRNARFGSVRAALRAGR
jgi:predicted aspartyl protease